MSYHKANPAEQPRGLTVILLNWNGWQETIIGLESLFQQKEVPYSLVLLDNGSTDDSIEQLIAWFGRNGAQMQIPVEQKQVSGSCVVHAEGAGITLLKNAVNEGFTGGNNLAIGYALERYNPDYIFLMNNDAILEQGCLKECLAAAQEHQASIVGTLVKSVDRNTVLFSGAEPLQELFYFVAPKSESVLPEVWETGRVEASGELIDTKFLREHHARWHYYLDPRFFIYCEETDLALSARAFGRKIIMTKRAVIYHGHAISMGGHGNPMQYYYSTRNRIFLAQRWLPVLKKAAFHLYFIPSRLIRIAQLSMQGKRSVVAAVWEGLRDGYVGRDGKWQRHKSRA